ncbi:MAG: ABC transporter substrate-binding protein, partial [Rubricella sp.]
RVVSINLCTDILVLQLADPGQIAALTFLATDPRSSILAEEAAGFPLIRGRAEEVFALDPDLVLAGAFSDPA